jgi:hypothetical protein
MAPDLDLRPGEPTRSTLRRWLLTCRNCGAAAPDLAALAPSAADTVASAPYRALAGPAAPFLRFAMICTAAGRPAEAAEATVEAAWAAEDAGEAEAARAHRLAAAALLAGDAEPRARLRRLDLLRRAGAFAEAAALADAIAETLGEDEEAARILAFQRARIAAGDDGRHLISSALRPPAHAPHVSHGKAAPRSPGLVGGLIGRLFGRRG